MKLLLDGLKKTIVFLGYIDDKGRMMPSATGSILLLYTINFIAFKSTDRLFS